LELPDQVWLWVASVVLIMMHATVPEMPVLTTLVGFFFAVAGVVWALWDESNRKD
jgi:hypothetical protein